MRVFGNSLIAVFIASIGFFSATLQAERGSRQKEPFSLSEPIFKDENGRDRPTVSQLTHKAVVEWLQNYMGSERYLQVEDKVKPELTQQYIINFSKRRFELDGQVYLEVFGDLNIDSEVGLPAWVQLVSAETMSSKLRPLFVLSSSVPGHEMDPRLMVRRSDDSRLLQTFVGLSQTQFRKFSRGGGTDRPRGLSSNGPARTLEQIGELQRFGVRKGYNGVQWLHLSACASCGGAKLEAYYYNLNQLKVLRTKNINLKLKPAMLGNGKLLQEILKPAVETTKKVFESLVSNATLFSPTYRVIVRGIMSTRAFDESREQLANSGVLVQKPILLRAQSAGAEFEILSLSTRREIESKLNRLSNESIQFRLM